MLTLPFLPALKRQLAAEGSGWLISEHNRDSPLPGHNKQCEPRADPDGTEASPTALINTGFSLGLLTSYPFLYLVCCVTLYCALLCVTYKKPKETHSPGVENPEPAYVHVNLAL